MRVELEDKILKKACAVGAVPAAVIMAGLTADLVSTVSRIPEVVNEMPQLRAMMIYGGGILSIGGALCGVVTVGLGGFAIKELIYDPIRGLVSKLNKQTSEGENKNLSDIVKGSVNKLSQQIQKQKTKYQNLTQKLGTLKTEVNEKVEKVKTCGQKIDTIGGRYILSGFLPRKVQEKIAEKHNENTLDYWAASACTELIAGIGLAMIGVDLFPPLLAPGLALMVSSELRVLPSVVCKKTFGHPVTTIPYHLVKQPYNLVKSRLSKREKK